MHMSLDLVMSQDIFQIEMDQIIKWYPSTILCIHDDLCVYAKRHDESHNNLLNLMTAVTKNGLVFNRSNNKIKQYEIVFYSTIFSRKGIKPDPEKIHSITEMSPPMMGMINFMQPFVPPFSYPTVL